MSRARLITAASFAGNLGWGAILPYQYAYVVDARHWGATAGVLTGTLFCIGAVVTAPFAGRLADRYSAARLAVVFALLAAVACSRHGRGRSPDSCSSPRCSCSGRPSPRPPPRPRSWCSSVSSRRSAGRSSPTSSPRWRSAWPSVRSPPAGGRPRHTRAACGRRSLPPRSASLSPPACCTLPRVRRRTTPALTDPCPRARPELDSELVGTLRDLPHAGREPAGPAARASSRCCSPRGSTRSSRPACRPSRCSRCTSTPTTVGTAAAVNCLVIVALQWLVVKVTGKQPGRRSARRRRRDLGLSWLLLEVALFTGAARRQPDLRAWPSRSSQSARRCTRRC